jgi:chromate transporter
LFALATKGLADASLFAWLHGLLVVAVAVVAQAVWGMATTLCPDRPRAGLALLSAGIALALPTGLGQLAILAGAGLVGWRWLRMEEAAASSRSPLRIAIPRPLAVGCLVVFGCLLIGLPMALLVVRAHGVALFASFYRSGALVFGGGHVVLPLPQAAVVAPGWASTNQFLIGYGAAQAVPGPLFTFSAYLGAVEGPIPNAWGGALV